MIHKLVVVGLLAWVVGGPGVILLMLWYVGRKKRE